tara:strand:- start:162 stop:1076 length:915 start_codon:yes stop_codon:yes gene_type:complete
MKYLSIFTTLLIFFLGCDEEANNSTQNPSNNNSNETSGGGTTGGGELEIDYSICQNCIWLQNDCNGNWFIAYNTNSAIKGFQFNISGGTISEISGGDAADNGFTLSFNSENGTIIGFSLGGNFIPAGNGKLIESIMLNLPPEEINNIIFSNSNAESIDISYYGIIGCYNVSLDSTGNTQLTIFNTSINNLEFGDEIGIFDSNGILNYGDCSNQRGELLVGSGIWSGNQLNIVSIGSADLCNYDGVQLSGYVNGNELKVKVYRASNQTTYYTQITMDAGIGIFGEPLQSITEINFTDSFESRGLF